MSYKVFTALEFWRCDFRSCDSA